MARGFDVTAYIRDRLPLAPVPGFAGILLHRAEPHSGIGRLAERAGHPVAPPYWAYVWAGGLAIAHHLHRFPDLVRGRSVIDLGAGSGLLAIVAARLGAARVIAADIDPFACAAIRLNAAANDVIAEVSAEDHLARPDLLAGVEVILAGDLFYDPAIAARALAALARAPGTVLIGDPGRTPLPRDALRVIAEYPVPDMGDARGAPPARGLVLVPRRG